MIKFYNLNGELVPKEKATLHVSDLSIQRGYGIFDFFYVQKGQPTFLDDYLDRFENSGRLMELRLPISRTELKEQIFELIEVNGMPDSAIKMILTGGYAPDGYAPPARQNLLLMSFPQRLYGSSTYSEGIKLMTYPHVREMAEVKTLNYTTGIRLLKALQQAQADEVLYHNNVHVSESARSNFFIVTPDDTIVTPNHDILWGITRKHILQRARQHYRVEERPLLLEEVFSAKEAFLSSTTKGALPVVQIDEHTVGDGTPGKVTKHLYELYWQGVDEYIHAALEE